MKCKNFYTTASLGGKGNLYPILALILFRVIMIHKYLVMSNSTDGQNLGLYRILTKEQYIFREVTRQRKRVLSFQGKFLCQISKCCLAGSHHFAFEGLLQKYTFILFEALIQVSLTRGTAAEESFSHCHKTLFKLFLPYAKSNQSQKRLNFT